MSLFAARRHAGPAPLPDEGRLPGFEGATGWLNSPALTPADLRGKVVLVDFWTYTCINWLRTLAYVRAWAEKYGDRGLVVVGVHTPEFPFEHDVDNVRFATKDMSVGYPVALDGDYAVWRAFDNRYWPAIYVADGQGKIRHHQFGEGAYGECETIVQQLLGESGRAGIAGDLVSLTPEGFEAQADWANLASPEAYLGYRQGQNFASPGGAAFDGPRTYVAPGPLRLNHWALAGEWTVGAGARSRQARRAGASPSATMRATFISSWGRARQGRRCRSACSSTKDPPATLTGSTSTNGATERSPGRGSISWCASVERSSTARSRSRFSHPASRRTCSPSARRGGIS